MKKLTPHQVIQVLEKAGQVTPPSSAAYVREQTRQETEKYIAWLRSVAPQTSMCIPDPKFPKSWT